MSKEDDIVARLTVYGQPKMTRSERNNIKEWLARVASQIIYSDDYSSRIVFTLHSGKGMPKIPKSKVGTGKGRK